MTSIEAPVQVVGLGGGDYKDLPRVESPPMMIRVTAPASLPGGYTFEANTSNGTLTVTVPPGGVDAGEIFLVPEPDSSFTKNQQRIDAPTGRWKDGLFDCFTYGILHPSVCCACWCTQVGMAQVMQRMHLTWLGSLGDEVTGKKAFKVIVTIFLSYTVFSYCLDLLLEHGDLGEFHEFVHYLRYSVQFLFIAWSIYVLMKTRENLRRIYSIPEENLHGCEDLCCSAFCSCCTVAQMARHTGEYEKYHATWLSENGLPDHAPSVV